MKKCFLIVCDGIGDRPIASLNRQTPLEAAKTPNLDKLAQMGISGAMHTIAPGVKPGSDTAHLALFGYDVNAYYTGRGPFEVAGLNMEVKPGDICFRVNAATVDDQLKVVDRRAGRIDDTGEIADLLDGTEIDGVKFLVKKGTGYRLGLIMRGKNLSSAITDADPKEVGLKVKSVEAKDSTSAAKFTAKVLNQFLALSHQKLENLESVKPANYLLVRGAGTYPQIPGFQEKWGLKAAAIAGAGLYKGIAKVLGMTVVDVPGATGKPDSDLSAKVTKALELKDKYDFIYIHFKGADSLGEDGNVEGKIKFIEKTDAVLKPFISLKDSLVVVTADHSTPCGLKDHSADDVPVTIISDQVRDDEVEKFSERDCAKGRLGHILGVNLMPIVVDLMGLAQKFGA